MASVVIQHIVGESTNWKHYKGLAINFRANSSDRFYLVPNLSFNAIGTSMELAEERVPNTSKELI